MEELKQKKVTKMLSRKGTFGGGKLQQLPADSTLSNNGSFSMAAPEQSTSAPSQTLQMALLETTLKENDHYKDELLVKSQMIASLATALHHANNKFNDGIKGEAVAVQKVADGYVAELEKSRQVVEVLTSRLNFLEAHVKDLEEQVSKAEGRTTIQKLLEVATREKLDAEAKLVEWKAKVKEGLEESKKKEQMLLTQDIELRTRIKFLESELDNVKFELATTSARRERGVRSQEVQTEAIGDTSSLVDGHLNSKLVQDHLQPMSPNPISPKHLQSNTQQDPTEVLHAAVAHFSPRVLLRQSASRFSEKGRFPLPWSPLQKVVGPQSQRSASGTMQADKHRQVSGDSSGMSSSFSGSAAAAQVQPELPPFIVTMHYNSRGWSLDTKHRITHGMTVVQLISECCSRFSARFQLTLEADTMCVKLNHDRAKRMVTLSCARELHSFSYFLKCQRDNVPITLYLSTRDELSDCVNDYMISK